MEGWQVLFWGYAVWQHPMEMHLLAEKESDWVWALNSLTKESAPITLCRHWFKPGPLKKKKNQTAPRLRWLKFHLWIPSPLQQYSWMYNLKIASLVPGDTWRVGTHDEKWGFIGGKKFSLLQHPTGYFCANCRLQFHCHIFWYKDVPCWRRASSWSRGQLLWQLKDCYGNAR